MTQSETQNLPHMFNQFEPNDRATVSVVYRALNEGKWFRKSLEALATQETRHNLEVVLVDSGSTDDTLAIAEDFNVRVTHIRKEDFSFGRSLNQGCDFATGDYLVFISAHCIPHTPDWLDKLVEPLLDFPSNGIAYTYGRQIGHDVSHFSEKRLFEKYYPETSALPQDGFFCNNANSAVVRSEWEKYRFDEEVTGLEDMVLAKAFTGDGLKIGYVSDSTVIHIHEETLEQTQRRYYREALTLRDIMPEVQIQFFDFVRYFFAGCAFDVQVASEKKELLKQLIPILSFRFAQYWGTYKGHNENRKLSRAQKESYYYPRPS